MSSFDDEFGLFGEEQEAERRTTLGARRIASNETIIDDVEPEDEGPPRRRLPVPGGGKRTFRRPEQRRAPDDPAAAQKRAGELLEFLAKKLVDKADVVAIESYPAENGEQAVIELAVDPEDIGKVIGRGGRVAHALRTIVRATAEGRISVEIFDTDEFYDESPDDESEEAEDPKDAPE